MNGKTMLENVTCARLPATSLESLAGLRRLAGISVVHDGNHAWVFWENGDDRVLRAVLPVLGVELFERRGETWHRPGRLIPSFGIPSDVETIPLHRAVTPESFKVELPREELARPLPIRLARNSRPRPTTAVFCPMIELARWADMAPSIEFEAIRGAIQGESALLLGRDLPSWPGSIRYWGRQILVPIGFEPRPNLPEETLLKTLGRPGDVIFRLIPGSIEGDDPSIEAIPIEAFRQLSRAGVRLAQGARMP